MRHRSLQSGKQFRPRLSFGVCHPLSVGNDQKRRAPVNCSVIRTGGLGPINARTSRLGQLMIPLTCVAQGHLVHPGSDDEMCGVPPVHTARAEVIRSPLALRAFFESRGWVEIPKVRQEGARSALLFPLTARPRSRLCRAKSKPSAELWCQRSPSRAVGIQSSFSDLMPEQTDELRRPLRT
jgi:hypothetical protein